MSKNPDRQNVKSSLDKYKEKRKAEHTPEPIPDGTYHIISSEDNQSNTDDRKKIFVIHKHSASHLHWDLRIEKDGVLKSWAVPKEPPTEPGIKRLAIRVEDHPLEYADFEGIIPEGNYGAGKVEIWDKGDCQIEQEESPRQMIIIFNGKIIKGRYALINTSGKNWLFFKTKEQ